MKDIIMKEIETKYSFEDATFKSCQISDSTLIANFNSWDEKNLKIVFFNTIQVLYRINSFVSKIIELNDDIFLKEALNLRYKKIPLNHPFKLFAVIDIEKNPFLQVVAERIEIIKEG
jgi:hypothetical protein